MPKENEKLKESEENKEQKEHKEKYDNLFILRETHMNMINQVRSKEDDQIYVAKELNISRYAKKYAKK